MEANTEFDFDLYLLSLKFVQDYASSTYPELMYKQGRPYTCLVIDSHDDYFICVPFRSNIRHKNAFMFKGTARSRVSRSGLDYSKIVLIKNLDYIDSVTKAIVDQDEYNEMMANLPTITQEVLEYVDTYISHVNKTSVLHQREYLRRYQYSTLPYFHDVMGI